jgi:hypothetical protein
MKGETPTNSKAPVQLVSGFMFKKKKKLVSGGLGAQLNFTDHGILSKCAVASRSHLYA